MATTSNGQLIKIDLPDTFRRKWQTLPKDEFLYRFLLATTALKAYDDGLPDEEQKVLKYFGVKYWEPGMEEVVFEGKSYKVILD